VGALVGATERIARGDFDLRLPTSRRDELGALAGAMNGMAAGLAQRDRIKDTFGKFVDPRVVEEIIADPEKLRPGGDVRVQTVLFCDLARFTAISERLRPAEVVGLLNGYLAGVSAIVAEERGILDKFIGDAAVAFWGPPITDDHATRACRAALRIVQHVAGMADECRRLGIEPIAARVGVATGPVLVGNIGSASKFNYTVMGDAANLGARLESANKVYGTSVLVSGETAAMAAEAIALRRVDRVRVVGRRTPVDLFEPRAESDGAVRDAFARAWTLYEARDWRGAAEAYQESVRFLAGDGVARVMAARCLEFASNGTPADFDGAWALDTK
jgi:adenylate cyclase